MAGGNIGLTITLRQSFDTVEALPILWPHSSSIAVVSQTSILH